MENDLISRSALVNAIATEFDKLPIEADRLSILVTLANAIKSTPTICPDSLRERGRWIHKKNWDKYVCSVCSNEEDRARRSCPECGARMDLET